ncbi:hypothetical protein GCM10017771_11010 [Streptomyces capitiformicae]|uniref:Uncharacterized protein n=1 Tax=Streptomyces capitiformicae TaxID=2014920 RepID=A0A919GFT5_9ACTN|nr:hypothetical protein GCM10017771_11010 [Streptomyces capitiformicae]
MARRSHAEGDRHRRGHLPAGAHPRAAVLPHLPNGTSWTPCADPGDLPQVEGMVVDPVNKVLYAGQEDVGI